MFGNKIKKLILGYRASSDVYINFLRKQGIEIGNNVRIYRPFNTTIDFQNPHLLTIGNDVQITGPVTILTHDYSWSVLKKKYNYIYGNQRKTKIGNNVIIGWGATILGGSHIGDNVIIGANSVVSGKIEPDSVYAGNPARKIMSLEAFKEKREKRQLSEAKSYVLEYKKKYGSIPSESQLSDYFFLFRRNDDIEQFHKNMTLMENYDDSLKVLKNHKPKFNNYKEFIKYCLKDCG